MDKRGKGIRRLPVQKDIEFDQTGRAVIGEMIIKRSVSLRDALEFVVKVENYLRKRKIVVEFHPVGSDVVLTHEGAAFVQTQLHYRSEELGFGDDLRTDEGLFDAADKRLRRKAGRIMHIQDLSLGGIDFIGDVGDGGDDVHVEFPEEPFLNNFEVQKP